MKFLNEIDSAAMLKQDAEHRLVTDQQIEKWDSLFTSGVSTKKWKSGNVTVFGVRSFSEVLEEASRLNLNTVTIPTVVSATSATDSNPILDLVKWENTKQIASGMRNMGYQVILEPFPYIANGTIVETEWNPTDKVAWFVKWKSILVELSTFAEDENLEGLYVASNLIKMESMTSNWISLLSHLRTIFSGKLIYRTNWWITASWAPETVTSYNAKLNNALFGYVDVIAIAAYFEITDKVNPTKADLKAGLYSVPLHGQGQNIYEEVRAFHTKWNKPIFFGELGICPFSQAAMNPWSNVQGSQEYSEETQKNWFNAFYEVFGLEEWFLGYSIFTIVDSTSHYRVSERLAEAAIREHNFGGNNERVFNVNGKTGNVVLDGTDIKVGGTDLNVKNKTIAQAFETMTLLEKENAVFKGELFSWSKYEKIERVAYYNDSVNPGGAPGRILLTLEGVNAGYFFKNIKNFTLKHTYGTTEEKTTFEIIEMDELEFAAVSGSFIAGKNYGADSLLLGWEEGFETLYGALELTETSKGVFLENVFSESSATPFPEDSTSLLRVK